MEKGERRTKEEEGGDRNEGWREREGRKERNRKGGKEKTVEAYDCSRYRCRRVHLLAEPFRRMSTALLSPTQKIKNKKKQS